MCSLYRGFKPRRFATAGLAVSYKRRELPKAARLCVGAIQQYCISCRFSCSDKAEYFKRQELPKGHAFVCFFNDLL